MDKIRHSGGDNTVNESSQAILRPQRREANISEVPTKLPDAMKKGFRKPFGIDKKPNPPSKEECLEAVRQGLSGERGLRDLKDLTNIVDRWAQSDSSGLEETTKQGLATHFKAVHDAWKVAKYMRFFSGQCSKFQAMSRNFLEYVRDNILPADRQDVGFSDQHTVPSSSRAESPIPFEEAFKQIENPRRESGEYYDRPSDHQEDRQAVPLSSRTGLPQKFIADQQTLTEDPISFTGNDESSTKPPHCWTKGSDAPLGTWDSRRSTLVQKGKEVERSGTQIKESQYSKRFQSITEGITSFDKWYNSYMTAYREQYQKNRNQVFKESFIPGLQEWQQKYADLVSNVQRVQRDLVNPSNSNKLEQSFNDYDHLRLRIEHTGIDFLNIIDKSAGSVIFMSRERLEKHYRDFNENMIRTSIDLENTYNLYKDTYHAMAEIVKTYGPEGPLDPKRSLQALKEALNQIASFEHHLQPSSKKLERSAPSGIGSEIPLKPAELSASSGSDDKQQRLVAPRLSENHPNPKPVRRKLPRKLPTLPDLQARRPQGAGQEYPITQEASTQRQETGTDPHGPGTIKYLQGRKEVAKGKRRATQEHSPTPSETETTIGHVSNYRAQRVTDHHAVLSSSGTEPPQLSYTKHGIPPEPKLHPKPAELSPLSYRDDQEQRLSQFLVRESVYDALRVPDQEDLEVSLRLFQDPPIRSQTMPVLSTTDTTKPAPRRELTMLPDSQALQSPRTEQRSQGETHGTYQPLKLSGRHLEVESLMDMIGARKCEVEEIKKEISEKIEEPMMALFSSRPTRENMRKKLNKLDKVDELYKTDGDESMEKWKEVYRSLGRAGLTDASKFHQLRDQGKSLEAELEKAKKKLTMLEKILDQALSGSHSEEQRQTREHQLATGPAAQHLAKVLRKSTIGSSNSEPSREMSIEDLNRRIKDLGEIIQIDDNIQKAKERSSGLEYSLHTPELSELSELLKAPHSLSVRERRRDSLMENLSVQSMDEVRRLHRDLEAQLGERSEAPRDSFSS